MGMEPDIEPRDILDAAAQMITRMEHDHIYVSPEDRERVLRAINAVELYTTSELLKHDAQQKRRQLQAL